MISRIICFCLKLQIPQKNKHNLSHLLVSLISQKKSPLRTIFHIFFIYYFYYHFPLNTSSTLFKVRKLSSNPRKASRSIDIKFCLLWSINFDDFLHRNIVVCQWLERFWARSAIARRAAGWKTRLDLCSSKVTPHFNRALKRSCPISCKQATGPEKRLSSTHILSIIWSDLGRLQRRMWVGRRSSLQRSTQDKNNIFLIFS